MKLVVVPQKARPKGIKCNVCGKTAKYQQTVLMDKIVGTGYTIWHTDCMKSLLDSTPVYLHKDDLADKLDTIAQQFEEGNYFGE